MKKKYSKKSYESSPAWAFFASAGLVHEADRFCRTPGEAAWGAGRLGTTHGKGRRVAWRDFRKRRTGRRPGVEPGDARAVWLGIGPGLEPGSGRASGRAPVRKSVRAKRRRLSVGAPRSMAQKNGAGRIDRPRCFPLSRTAALPGGKPSRLPEASPSLGFQRAQARWPPEASPPTFSLGALSRRRCRRR